MGASVGVSVGVLLAGVGTSPTVDVHAGMGKGKGNGTSQINSHVSGTGDIVLESGGDTNLKGAVVAGETVTADVGGDLNIVSVPDTGESSNESASLGISFGSSGITGVSPGGGIGSGKTNWIDEQSGLVSSGKMAVTVSGNTHLDAGKIVSENGDLTLDTNTLTYDNITGSRKYQGFDIDANIDLTPKGDDGEKRQLPEQTSQPRSAAEGTYQLDDERQQVRATVGPGEIIIGDEDKQAELEASGQTEDLATLNRDPEQAYEITRDKHIEIEYYLSDTSVKAALEAGKTVAEVVNDALDRMVADGKLSDSDYRRITERIAIIDENTWEQIITAEFGYGMMLVDRGQNQLLDVTGGGGGGGLAIGATIAGIIGSIWKNETADQNNEAGGDQSGSTSASGSTAADPCQLDPQLCSDYDISATSKDSKNTNVKTNLTPQEFENKLISNGYRVVSTGTSKNGSFTVLSNGSSRYTIYIRTSTQGNGAQYVGPDGNIIKYMLK